MTECDDRNRQIYSGYLKDVELVGQVKHKQYVNYVLLNHLLVFSSLFIHSVL